MTDENKAQERIWLGPSKGRIYYSPCTDLPLLRPWIREDAALAMVAAACEGLVNQAVGMADDADEKCFVEDRMRDAIPDDARAALDRMLAEARREGDTQNAKSPAAGEGSGAS